MKSLLVRLQALSTLKNIDIDLDLCKEVIRENLGDIPLQRITLIQILSYVSKKQQINQKRIIGKTRDQETALARQIIMFLTRKLTNLSLKHIGKELGGRDHSTVIHSFNLIESKIKQEPAFNKLISSYVDDLNNF